MAKPRIFISSTFYDLRSIRADIARFIKEKGYESVMHERGQVSYGREEKLEEYAYREIEFCEVLVCVIGGKFGTPSNHEHYSITQKELKVAIEKGRQVYIFIDRPVYEEFNFFKNNKAVEGVMFRAVDNKKIYDFIEEMYALPSGNPIFPFETSHDITAILEEQWAGLFQRLLLEAASKPQAELISELQRSLLTVGQLVQYLTEARDKGDRAVQEILFSSHPIFDHLKKLLFVQYRVYFTNLQELNDWLVSRIYTPVKKEKWDEKDVMEWVRVVELKNKNIEQRILKVSKHLFREDGSLKPMTIAQWDNARVTLEKSAVADKEDDDEIPF